jgi:hypothetical protein
VNLGSLFSGQPIRWQLHTKLQRTNHSPALSIKGASISLVSRDQDGIIQFRGIELVWSRLGVGSATRWSQLLETFLMHADIECVFALKSIVVVK